VHTLRSMTSSRRDHESTSLSKMSSSSSSSLLWLAKTTTMMTTYGGGSRFKMWLTLLASLGFVCTMLGVRNVSVGYNPHNNDTTTDTTTGDSAFEYPPLWEEGTPPPLDCEEISKLSIVRTLGEGQQKVAYEVRLANGASAVAKRCKSANCIEWELLKAEADKLQRYQSRGVQGLVAIYGACYRPYNYHESTTNSTASTGPQHHDDYNVTDLTVGHTVIYEKGQVLMKNWGEKNGHFCLAWFFTAADIEDLRIMARTYSAAGISLYNPKSRCMDNKYPTQFVLTRSGIRHADLDNTYDCLQKGGCPDAARLFEDNCRILVGGVAQRRYRPDCSMTFSAKHPVADLTKHIDVAKARSRCLLDFFGAFWLHRSSKKEESRP
jgi:hypothetical protein